MTWDGGRGGRVIEPSRYGRRRLRSATTSPILPVPTVNSARSGVRPKPPPVALPIVRYAWGMEQDAAHVAFAPAPDLVRSARDRPGMTRPHR